MKKYSLKESFKTLFLVEDRLLALVYECSLLFHSLNVQDKQIQDELTDHRITRVTAECILYTWFFEGKRNMLSLSLLFFSLSCSLWNRIHSSFSHVLFHQYWNRIPQWRLDCVAIFYTLASFDMKNYKLAKLHCTS